MNNGPEQIKLGDGGMERLGPEGIPEDPQLEVALRRSLHREDAPAGFADRVLAKALSGTVPVPSIGGPKAKSKVLHWPQGRIWITGAVAAALVAGVLEGGLAWQHVREQQRKIVQATQQFQTTERITVHALAQAREQLQRAGVQLSVD